jgi:hypothetical protein
MINNELLNKIKYLPREAAPFLSFKSSSIQKLTDIYAKIQGSFSSFYIIGNDGSGNPICIDADTSKIYLFDHDYNFKIIYINRNIDELVTFLKLYENHIANIIKEYGDDAFFDFKYPKSLIDDLEIKYSKIDQDALLLNSFWGSTLEMDKANVNSA